SIRRVAHCLAVAGASDIGAAVCGGGGDAPRQCRAVAVGRIEYQCERGRRAIFRHGDVGAVAFGNDRRIVHGGDIDGPALRCRCGTIFTSIRDFNGNVGTGDAIGRGPLDQAGSRNRHATRRLGEAERQVGAIVAVIRIVDDQLVAVSRRLGGGGRGDRGNGRRIGYGRAASREGTTV